MQLQKSTSIWLGGIYGLLVGLLTISVVDYVRPERMPIHLTTVGFILVISASALLGNYAVEKMIEYNELQWHKPLWVIWASFVATFPLIVVVISLILLVSFSP